MRDSDTGPERIVRRFPCPGQHRPGYKAQLRYGANRPIGVRKEHLDSSHLVSIVHVVHPARDELVEPPVRHP